MLVREQSDGTTHLEPPTKSQEIENPRDNAQRESTGRPEHHTNSPIDYNNIRNVSEENQGKTKNYSLFSLITIENVEIIIHSNFFVVFPLSPTGKREYLLYIIYIMGNYFSI